MRIRAERPSDALAINDLTIRAFTGMPYSEGTEAPIIRLLRQSGDLALSLVAEENGIVIGHIAFSPIKIGAHQNWFGLGPIAVEPSRQRAGIGKVLINKGLEMLKDRGASGVALIGNPDVYRSSGFTSDGRLTEILGMVEKPAPGTAPSNLMLPGRYILQPEVMRALDAQETGAGGEIQLTDAMAKLVGTQPFHAWLFDGQRYDCGSAAGFVIANLAVGLQREDVAPAVREFLGRN